MTATPQTASIIVRNVDQPAWCVYEHWMNISADPLAPPECVYVNTCALSDVFRMIEAKNNSEWRKLTANPDAAIMIRIIMTSDDRAETRNYAVAHIKSLSPMPRCNLHGFNLFGRRRPIVCSNGKEYATQSAAALDLGVNQGAISQHLQGNGKSVGGYSFAYRED